MADAAGAAMAQSCQRLLPHGVRVIHAPPALRPSPAAPSPMMRRPLLARNLLMRWMNQLCSSASSARPSCKGEEEEEEGVGMTQWVT